METAASLCGKAFRKGTAKTVVFDIILMLVYLMVTCFVIVFGKVCYAVFLVISAAVDAFIVMMLIRRLAAKRDDMITRAEKFSVSDFETIAQRMIVFGTFFMLDDCLWFFSENYALDYEEIEKMTSVYHSTNHIPDGVRLDFRLKNKKVYRIWVKNWIDYKKYNESFLNDLNDKINKNNFQEVQ